MRILALAKNGINKLRANQTELKSADFEDSIKPLPPGEWCVFRSGDEQWVGFVNPMIDEKYSCAHVLQKVSAQDINMFSPEVLIKSKIKKAFEKRQRFSDYHDGARIFYGASDGLPGLIIDLFTNASIVQINSSGVDRYRDLVKSEVATLTNKPAILLDNDKYREKEFLPVFEKEAIPDLSISENGIKFHLRSEVIQKVGFYYDHRENRRQLTSLLERMKNYDHGVDLFCYAGAWGLAALKAGTKAVSFIDQGDFFREIEEGLNLNGFSGRGDFKRTDVFKYLDQCLSESKTFDLILCDPPAFAKSMSQKKDALEGYSKLHRKVFKVARPGALIAFSSCTHYVDHQEFQKNILDAAHRENKKVQLLYCGMQGFDHPVSSLEDRSNYIKSYFYILEN